MQNPFGAKALQTDNHKGEGDIFGGCFTDVLQNVFCGHF